MIFITLGTQNFPMNRVIEEIEKLILEGEISAENVVLQHGYSNSSSLVSSYKFLSTEEFINVIEKSDIVITHGGTGSILKALENNKKVICIPRKSELGEHVDDHQFEISNEFKKAGYLLEILDISELREAIQIAEQTNFVKYQNTSELIPHLKKLIIELLK